MASHTQWAQTLVVVTRSTVMTISQSTPQDMGVSVPTMTISYAGLTITAEQDAIDDLYDPTAKTVTWASLAPWVVLSFAVVAETTDDAATSTSFLPGLALLAA